MKLYWKMLLYVCTAFYVQCKTVSKNNNLPLNHSWREYNSQLNFQATNI